MAADSPNTITRKVPAGFSAGRDIGRGARATAGGKKRQPKRGFSTSTSLPSTLLGRKKVAG
jgi:hypothetical protein